MIAQENSLLLAIPHAEPSQKPLTPVAAALTDDVYNALSWYNEKPAASDELYTCLGTVFNIVEDSLKKLEEQVEQQVQNKLGAGQATKYLLLVPDDERNQLVID